MAQADKATAVADIAEQFKSSTATVITEYRGLTVANLAELRRSLAGSATYSVAKNTLIKRAASDAGVEGLDQLFVGPTAIAFVSGEAVDAAKAIKKFAKDHKALVIKGGYMDGRALTVGRAVQRARLAAGQACRGTVREASRRRTCGRSRGSCSRSSCYRGPCGRGRADRNTCGGIPRRNHRINPVTPRKDPPHVQALH
jgi:ribosomal protein L10